MSSWRAKLILTRLILGQVPLCWRTHREAWDGASLGLGNEHFTTDGKGLETVVSVLTCVWHPNRGKGSERQRDKSLKDAERRSLPGWAIRPAWDSESRELVGFLLSVPARAVCTVLSCSLRLVLTPVTYFGLRVIMKFNFPLLDTCVMNH